MKKEELKTVTLEEFEKEMDELIEREKNKNFFLKIIDWIIYLPSRIKFSIKEHKLRHLKIGKSKIRNGKLYIEKVDWDVHWQTRNYLASIIRDYIKIFAEKAPIIGNCVYDQSLTGYDFIMAQEAADNDEMAKKWHDKLIETAKLFDDITENCDDLSDEEVYAQERINKAFDALKEIFNDLSW